MKLRINERNYLFEDIAAVKKYYPNIDDSTFMKLIALDPTYRDGSNSVGKYGKWILNLFKKGTISKEDFSEITPLLQQFTTYKNRIQNKDLNAYKTLDDLSNTLSQVVDDDSMLSDRQKLRFRKNVKAGRVSTSAEDDYDIVLETPSYIVYVPNTHEASMKLGKGTKWCTAHENPEWYNHYTSHDGKLYIVKNKQTGDRWQYSDKEGDFLDQNDQEFDILELMKSDAKLSKFFEKFLGVDYYSVDKTKTFVYHGVVPRKIRNLIKKVVIDRNVTSIKRYAFDNCRELTNITIPNSVTSIGDNAFSECTGLTNISIPDSVTSIGSGAFRYCESMTAVTIPDSVTSIGKYAFSGCTGLTDITVPDSVTSIGEYAFSECINLTEITISDSVTSIENHAFYNCASLTGITIPDSVTSIGCSAFLKCVGLESVNLPENITKIDDFAFGGCSSITSITIPNSVTWIGDWSFKGCGNLTVYTDNQYAIDYCHDNDIPVRPTKEFVKESFTKPLKLRIKEDTACIASKTSYMNEDGLDANGIYYFGNKPKKPINWKDYKPKKLRIKE